MAQAPMPMPMSGPPGGGPGGGGIGGDSSMGADPSMDSDGSEDCIVTICKSGDGSYVVYAGDEPDPSESGDMSGDDVGAMGPAGDAPAPPGGGSASPAMGQPADSIGAALKIAMDILQADKSSEGAPGNADDQFTAGFNGSSAPTPASGGMGRGSY